MKNNFPKVLVFGQHFNSTSGGGITLTNLFKGWPKNRIASVVSNYKHVVENEVCDNIFGLERWRFPICFLTKSKDKKPGKIEFNQTKFQYINNIREPQAGKLSNFLSFITMRLGILPFIHNNRLTEDFIKWVFEFNPDIIYTQLADVNVAKMVYNLSSILKKPIAIHIMDDWPKTLYREGLFSFYNRWLMKKYFLKLMDKSTVLMGISTAMCIEYKKRYAKDFIPFHNPIELSKWSLHQKNNWSELSDIKILYLGRVGIANSSGISDLVEVLSELKEEGKNISLRIYSPDYCEKLKNRIEININIKISPAIPNSEVPAVLKSSDILFLPLDFDEESINFARYSMPTKASEYMISGTPTLIYAPSGIALTDHAKENKWAYIVCEREKQKLKKAIIDLSINEVLRKKIGESAVLFAKENFDSLKVRDHFRQSLLIAS